MELSSVVYVLSLFEDFDLMTKRVVIGKRRLHLFESSSGTSIAACLDSLHLETLIRFCMEMLKFSEFDLERTTTKSTIIVHIFLSFLL